MDNRSLSHTRWKCQYHIVFIPKYRKRFVAQILVDIKKEQDELKDILGSEYQDYNLVMATTFGDRKSTRLNSSHPSSSRMPSSA